MTLINTEALQRTYTPRENRIAVPIRAGEKIFHE